MVEIKDKTFIAFADTDGCDTISCNESFKQQILQDHENAKRYEIVKTHYEDSQRCMIKIRKESEKDRQILKRLEEFYNDERLLLKSIVESDKCGNDYHLQILDLVTKLQKILEGKK